ncbi:MAG TPA: hypothetical protein VMD79_11410 [Solirubrobacteraceae bacterium]|nr:hypothetical protein [Solirubrobacteraceae bacterium]
MQDFGAHFRVAADDRELPVGEPAGLLQDAVGHARLADVVQHPGEPYAADARLGEAELPGHQLGVARDRLGVPGAAAESQVDRFGEVEHHGEEALAFDVARPAAAFARELAEDGAVADGAITTAVLRRVQSFVCGVQQRGGGLAVLRVARQAEAGGDRHGLLGELVAHGAAQTLGEHERLILAGVGEDQRELLTADARSGVDLALVRAEHARDAPQGGVADLGAGAVVDFLEMVQVADEHRQLAAAAPGAFELEVEQLAKAPPVGQSRQRIGAGGVVEACDQQLGAGAHRHDQDRGDEQGAHAHDPPGRGSARRGPREQ